MPVFGSFLTAVGTVWLIYYLSQYWEKPGAKWFVLSMIGQAVFSLSYAVGLLVFDPVLREALEIIAIIALNWLGVPFLGFALAYTGRGELLRSWTYRLLYVFPLSITVLLPLNSQHNLYWTNFTVDPVFGVATVSYSFEPLFYLTIFGGTTAAGVGALLLFDTVWSYGPLYRGEALAVGLSAVPPSVGLFLWLFEVGVFAQFNVLVLLLLPHIALDAYAFVGKGMFEFYPATSRAAEESAFENLQSPVFVLDESGRVVSNNPAATRLFDIDENEQITKPVSEVIDEEIDFESDSERITLQSGGRRREFRIESSPLMDSGDNHVGYTLLFQEITEQVQRKERLSVLNRVLRHNLRNELTVVQGHIGIAEKQTEDERGVQSLLQATDAVDDLIETSETARSIEQTLGSDKITPQPVTLTRILETTEEFGRSHPEVSISVDAPELTLQTDPAVFQSILGQLLQNAVEYNDAANPAIELSAEIQDSLFEITVTDNGPGIPEHELQVLEQGEETALEHGSGLGLWLVKWGTSRLGGRTEFQSSDDGTRVRLVFTDEILADQPAELTAAESTGDSLAVD